MNESEQFTTDILNEIRGGYNADRFARCSTEESAVNFPGTRVAQTISGLTYDKIGDVLGCIAILFDKLPSEINIGNLYLHNAFEDFASDMIMHMFLGMGLLEPAPGDGKTDPVTFLYDESKFDTIIGVVTGTHCASCFTQYEANLNCPKCNPPLVWWEAMLVRFRDQRCHPGGAFQYIILNEPQVGRMDAETRASLADILLWCEQHLPHWIRTKEGFREWCGTLE